MNEFIQEVSAFPKKKRICLVTIVTSEVWGHITTDM